MSSERAAQLVDAGIWLKLSGDIDGARRFFERALKLDPENERAKELLSQDVTAGPVPFESMPANPFERAPSFPTSNELDWGAATGTGAGGDAHIAPSVPPVLMVGPSPAPVSQQPPAGPSGAAASSPSTLTDDWGSATGQIASPVPQPAPPFATRSPAPAKERQTQRFAAAGGQPAASGPGRSTLPFAAPEPAAPRQTMMFAPQPQPPPAGPPPNFIPPAPPLAPPNLTAKPGTERLNRSTLTFSNQAEALGPSQLPEVSPMVIRLGDDALAEVPTDELPSIVDSLRNQVNARGDTDKSAPAPIAPAFPSPPNPPHAYASLDAPDPLSPTNIVLTDTTPDPSPPRATPPMFSEDPPSPFVKPVPRSGPDEDAWNWSANSPPSEPAFSGSSASPEPSTPLAAEASSGWDQTSDPGIKLADMSAPNHPLEFVSSSSRVTARVDTRKGEVAVLMRGAKDLIELDDHTGAMELIAKALALAPDDNDVRSLQERSERTLLAMFESKLGHLDKLPRVLLKDDEIIWLNLDHRAGFVLAQIDGAMSFEDLFAVSGMSRLDTARILAQLVDEGVISRGS